LSWLRTCPGAYALYDDGIGGGHFLVGTVTHEAVEEYANECARRGSGMDLALAEAVATRHSERVPEGDRESIVRMVTWVAARWDLGAAPGWRVENEKRLAVIVSRTQDGGVEVAQDHGIYGGHTKQWVVRGMLDRVRHHPRTTAGVVEVWDWKTDRTLAPRSYLHRDLQARIYGLLAAEAYGASRVIVHWEYLRFQISETYEFDDDDLDAAALELASLLEAGDAAIIALAETRSAPDAATRSKLAKDLFRPGSACATCPVFHRCELGGSAVGWFRAGDPIRDPNQYVLVQRAVDDYESYLREVIHANGPMPLASGDVIDLVPSERRSLLDNQTTIQALRELAPLTDAQLLELVATFSMDETASRVAKVCALKKKDVVAKLNEVASATSVLSLRIKPPGKGKTSETPFRR